MAPAPGSAAGPGAPALSLVVSTVGRPVQLERLLGSLTAGGPDPRLELVLVDQSGTDGCAAVVAAHADRLAATVARSARGLSLGRNVGLALARGAVVAFPDDDCWYAPDTVDWVLRHFAADPGLDVLAGVQLTADGRPSMLRWLPDAGPLRAATAHRQAISSTLFVRRELLGRIGGFDEGLGAGSTAGYLSGEETDLLLRALAAGARGWYDPQLVVYQDEPRDEPTAGFDDKMAGYGRGFGLVARRHRLSPAFVAWVLARKAAGAAVRAARGRADLAAADLAFARGVAGGYASARRAP